MRILLDTHVVLWWLDDNDSLSPRHRALIEASETEPWVSASSIWEMSIKANKGLLAVDGDILEAIRLSQMSVLPIDGRHAWAARLLPKHHADPFDRMLIAQGQLEGMAIATTDPAFGLYDVATV